MTSVELYNKLTPNNEKVFPAQLLSHGLSGNWSDMFSTFVKDAARCNGYNSDVYYDMKIIDESMQNFNPETEFEPIWVGFRKLGVDSTSYVLCRLEDQNVYSSLSRNYFALYSVCVENKDDNWYNVILREYYV